MLLGRDTPERILHEIFPGDVFGEAAFFDGGMSLGRFIVLSKTARYLTMSFADLRTLGQQDPALLPYAVVDAGLTPPYRRSPR